MFFLSHGLSFALAFPQRVGRCRAVPLAAELDSPDPGDVRVVVGAREDPPGGGVSEVLTAVKGLLKVGLHGLVI